MAMQDEICPKDLGRADSIRVEKRNGENFVFIAVRERAIATILIWEPVKYGLDKVEEAVDDALNNAAFLLKNKEIVNGGGAIEFATGTYAQAVCRQRRMERNSLQSWRMRRPLKRSQPSLQEIWE